MGRALKILFDLAIASAFTVGCLLYPYFDWKHDMLAGALSNLVVAAGFGGMLFVPLGMIWLWHEIARRRKSAPPGGRGYWFASISLYVALFACLTIFFLQVGQISGMWMPVLVGYLFGSALNKAQEKLKQTRDVAGLPFNSAPLYLIVIPLVAAAASAFWLEPFAQAARGRAMDKGAPLIADIERYYKANGSYPLSLMALHTDYEPEMVGVARYWYEPSGKAYNLFFEFPSMVFGTQEIVMYNKLGEHQMFSHDAHRLELTGSELQLRSGHYDVKDAGRPHWKRFLFD